MSQPIVVVSLPMDQAEAVVRLLLETHGLSSAQLDALDALRDALRACERVRRAG